MFALALAGCSDCLIEEFKSDGSEEDRLLQTAAVFAGGDVFLHPVFPERRVSGRHRRLAMEFLAGALVPLDRG